MYEKITTVLFNRFPSTVTTETTTAKWVDFDPSAIRVTNGKLHHNFFFKKIKTEQKTILSSPNLLTKQKYLLFYFQPTFLTATTTSTEKPIAIPAARSNTKGTVIGSNLSLKIC